MNKVHPIERNKLKDIREQFQNHKHSERNRLLFDFMIAIPLRVSDVISLKVKDVLEKDTLTITPRKSKRINKKTGVKGKGTKVTYDIHSELQLRIKEFCKDKSLEDYLFQSQKGKNTGSPLTRQGVWEVITKAATEAGLIEPIGCHSTRKTHARMLLEEHDDFTFVMQQLGHKDPASTMHYLCLTDEKRKKRIEAMNFFD